MSSGEEKIKAHSESQESLSIDPRQWPPRIKLRAAVIMGLFAFLEPFASSIIAPALPLIADDFGITSSAERNLVLSAFVLPYALGGILLAPMSENFGRRPILLISAFLFFAFTVGCGFAQSSAHLIVFRVFSGLGGCAPLAVGVALISDLYAPEERGSPMAVYMALQLAGPALGPIVGGWIAQTIDSWRWSFYICAIATAVLLPVGCFGLPETYAPRLNRKIEGSLVHDLRSIYRPLLLLATQPIIQVLAAYAAVTFGVYYLFLTTIASVFENTYGQSIGIASLHYLALLFGFACSVAASGKVMDVVYKKLASENPRPEARIPYLGASGTLLPAGLLLYGWTSQKQAFWIVPDIGLFLVGSGILAPLAAIQHYILDCYAKSGYAASAMAGMNVARFLAGFGFPLFADVLFDSLGLGWGNSILALVAFVVGSFSVSLWVFGPRLRERSSYAACE
ncbi:hypothetical protein CERZMDRAFT_51371 [Cercospora zeae-maydis SCOH1-5]|uniref:Major facilitator superfamily (MFS) profile domain-containing protein n=1 Tax=Cercospora zeae-maydis SCOH1-5 TaxID=717836 RepID=A0A6A6EYL9_9PEZI|nr:hypothetical protein CERZMDRAFT_51371 [Cercospora zeae-maydis SCOH1-5]